MAYTIEEHNHRLAAWDAGRSASVKGCRFKVENAKVILEACGFNADFGLAGLPHPDDLDQTHEKWRKDTIAAASTHGISMTHGVAAKIINCYLKARFVCAGLHEHERVQRLHPPIDEVLLKTLAEKDFGGFKKQWRKFRYKRWSKFDSDTYQSVIDHIRQSLSPDKALWKIEEYWEGHQ
jgi:hypothetical protein